MSQYVAELLSGPTQDSHEPVTLAEVKRSLNLTTDEHDGHLRVLIFAARDTVGTQLGRELAESRWHVPARSLKNFQPHRIIAERDGGFEIAVGYAPDALPPVVKGAILTWIAWAFENSDVSVAEAPNYRFLRERVEAHDAQVAAAAPLLLECLKDARQFLEQSQIDVGYINEVIAAAEGHPIRLGSESRSA